MSDGFRQGSGGVRRVSDGVRKGSDGFRKVSDDVRIVSYTLLLLYSCFNYTGYHATSHNLDILEE